MKGDCWPLSASARREGLCLAVALLLAAILIVYFVL